LWTQHRWTTALGQNLVERPSKAGIAVDDAEHRGRQAAPGEGADRVTGPGGWRFLVV